jgi:uncharacterized protein YabN with tetrapyrrole methylase and pyrophosphatase domain
MPLNSPSQHYCEKQWAISTRSLENEFDIGIKRVHMIDEVKNMFFEFVEINRFSESACISLYYRLFLFSTLVLMQVIENKGVHVEGVSLADLKPVWTSSVKWSSKAADTANLEEKLGNINYSLRLLMDDLGNEAS